MGRQVLGRDAGQRIAAGRRVAVGGTRRSATEAFEDSERVSEAAEALKLAELGCGELALQELEGVGRVLGLDLGDAGVSDGASLGRTCGNEGGADGGSHDGDGDDRAAHVVRRRK